MFGKNADARRAPKYSEIYQKSMSEVERGNMRKRTFNRTGGGRPSEENKGRECELGTDKAAHRKKKYQCVGGETLEG